MDNYVVGLGEVLWDVLPDGKKLGGAPANFAFHVSQFGMPSCVVSAVGRDALGDEIITALDSKGLDHRISRVDFPTGTVQVELDDAGVPRYDIREHVAWDNIPFSANLRQLAAQTRAACFGSLAQRSEVSRASINSFLDAMPADSLVVFDVNLRQQFFTAATLRSSMNRCDILKINDEEFDVITRLFDIPGNSLSDKCHALISTMHLQALILTCGADGSYVFTLSGSRFLPSPKVAVADTVGAGDSFTAAFVATLLQGGSIADAHEVAVRTSAFVCSQEGAMPTLPDDLLK